MQTETQNETFPGYTVETGEPLKAEILAALRKFARQRPGLDFGNYGDLAAYRAESRDITRDLSQALALLRRVELCPSITAQNIIDAAKHAYSGRLSIEVTPLRVKVNYCTGQYFPTEYRRAVCAVAASVLWDWVRDKAMPSPVYGVEWKNERGEWMDTGKSFDNSIMAEMYAAEMRETRQRESQAFETPPRGYGETLIVEKYRAAGLSRAISGGDWLRRYFRREFGRGIASRWFN